MQTAAVHAADTPGQVQEYLLAEHQTGGRQWLLQRDNISIKDKAVFAPANLRATADNEEYQQLVQYWMSNKYTLRYSGGMVPDIHHILTKVGHLLAAIQASRLCTAQGGSLAVLCMPAWLSCSVTALRVSTKVVITQEWSVA